MTWQTVNHKRCKFTDNKRTCVVYKFLWNIGAVWVIHSLGTVFSTFAISPMSWVSVNTLYGSFDIRLNITILPVSPASAAATAVAPASYASVISRLETICDAHLLKCWEHDTSWLHTGIFTNHIRKEKCGFAKHFVTEYVKFHIVLLCFAYILTVGVSYTFRQCDNSRRLMLFNL
mgnify:CR=1 FL=1